MRKLEHFMIPINEIAKYQKNPYEKRINSDTIFNSFMVCGELSSHYNFEPLELDGTDFMTYNNKAYQEYVSSGDLDFSMGSANIDISIVNGYLYIDYATEVVRAVRDSLKELLSGTATKNEAQNTKCLRRIIEDFQNLYSEEEYFSDPNDISWYELDAFIEYYQYKTRPKFELIDNNDEFTESGEFLNEIIHATRSEFIESLNYLLEKGELTNQLLERAKEISSTVIIDLTDPLVELVKEGPVDGDWAIGYFETLDRRIYINHELLKYESQRAVDQSEGELALEDVYIPNLQIIIFHELIHSITARWYSAKQMEALYEEEEPENNNQFSVAVHTAFPRFINEALTENLALELYQKQIGRLDLVHKTYWAERVILGLLVNCLDLEKANTTPNDFFSSLRRAWLDSCSGLDTVQKPLSSYSEFFGNLHQASFSGILNRLSIIDEQLGILKVLQIVSSSKFDPHEKLDFEGLLSRKDLRLIKIKRHYLEIDETFPYLEEYRDYYEKNNKLIELAERAKKIHNKAQNFLKTEIDLKYGYGDSDISPDEKLLIAIFGEEPQRFALTKKDLEQGRKIYAELNEIIAQMKKLA
jgi:hypothetical protein